MKKIKFMALVLAFIMVFGVLTPALATDTNTQTQVQTVTDESKIKSNKAIGASIAIGISSGLAAIGMGIAIGKSAEGISRQPEAEGKIRNSLMLGLVFIETAIIYALIVAILVIFVL